GLFQLRNSYEWLLQLMRVGGRGRSSKETTDGSGADSPFGVVLVNLAGYDGVLMKVHSPPQVAIGFRAFLRYNLL
ncbi:MAG TPA: hypothetical protein VF707_05945, partial [Ardenticatenaceae bacterium]